MCRVATVGIGLDRVFYAVGYDAQHPHRGPADKAAAQKERQNQQVLKTVAPKLAKPDKWHAGDAPEQVLEWAIDAVDKAGTLSIIGVYPETMTTFPIGKAMNKNLTLKMGN